MGSKAKATCPEKELDDQRSVEPDLAHLLVPLREADPPEIDSTAAPPTTRTTRRRITKEELGQVRRGVLPRP